VHTRTNENFPFKCELEIGQGMEKLRKACVLDYKLLAKEVVCLREFPLKPKISTKIKELTPPQFCYCCIIVLQAALSWGLLIEVV